MIEFDAIPDMPFTGQQTELCKTMIKIAKECDSNACFLCRLHKKYKSIYIIASNFAGFKGDGIYEILGSDLESLCSTITTQKQNKFGNIRGNFFVSTIPITDKDLNLFITLLTGDPLDKTLIPDFSELIDLINKNHYDYTTMIDHVERTPQIMLDAYQNFMFTIERFDNDSLFEIVVCLFSQIIKRSQLDIDFETFVRFLYKIRSLYNDVPYHNWRHACDACQFVYFALLQKPIEHFIQPIDYFSLMTAAICHDVGHNGRSNDFHRQVNSKYAQESGSNQPPLEYHHQKITIEFLSNEFSKSIQTFNDETRRIYFKFVSNIILATDMSKHQDYIVSFNNIAGSYKDTEDERLLACQAIMKLADLSNTCRPFGEAATMSAQLQEEWYTQGDEQLKRGLEITKGFDRNNKTPLPQGQVGFYKYVTLKLLLADQKLFNAFDGCIQQFNTNLAEWEALCAQL
ncbi:3'5'-cyclic nucleotide phosphodiesterase family protein [Trichomonas vaginalis G3]|uniref:Phosphodiesterase n=1 Tax=Trichomonas vaginalis (strain ATCC PRA-98 / G3) TaxID=412133 RepID=A2GFY4_TRIV3|nr:3',5'-cyclic-nucleotide phosphodiesterase protein [Trichomonas vaginalis G3]EAX83932.1 3'5'-cyclic nucleotide phosphodiesterase family protein [Trichomonas vaginalis G3]KAI5484271.1 3',5'-cyclic-nucleotide phosphodiesterase protein [Trichomonas vaginalis G3]|eukprot:XP_001296862.1 3'5'-cyclic nucleotide phosphodiesterase family protein [Trichomonas vaginalis G3]